MQCDVESAYLHQFNIYLSWEQNLANGLGYNVVMKLCHEIFNKATTSTLITYLHQCL